MNKTGRYSLIATLAGGIAAPVIATKSEIREETRLAAVHNDDNSILGEDAMPFVSMELASRLDSLPESRDGVDSLLLNEKERKELGKSLNRFVAQVTEDEEAADFRQFKRAQGWED